jgi:zinc protease
VLDEVDMYVLKTNDGSTESYEYYNTKTFMKAKTVSTSKQGEEVVTSEMSFADYEELNGIMFPRTISLSVGPMTLEGKVSELKINDKIDLGPYSK